MRHHGFTCCIGAKGAGMLSRSAQVAGSVAPTLLESSVEAGQVLRDMIYGENGEKPITTDRAFAEKQAWSTFGANTALLGGSNAMEAALAFAPAGGKVMSSFLKGGLIKGTGTAMMEGSQEVLQNRFSDSAKAGNSAFDINYIPTPNNAEEGLNFFGGAVMGRVLAFVS